MGKFMRSLARFVRALRHEPPETPPERQMRAITRRVHEARHPHRLIGFPGASSRTEYEMVSKELAKGHEELRGHEQDDARTSSTTDRP